MRIHVHLPVKIDDVNQFFEVEMAHLPQKGEVFYLQDYDKVFNVGGHRKMVVKSSSYVTSLIKADPKQIETPSTKDRFTELVEHFAAYGQTLSHITDDKKLCVVGVRGEVVLAYEDD